MDYTRGVQTLRTETEKVASQWAGLYHTFIESKFFILLVMVISNLLYLILSMINKLFSYRRR